MSDHFHRLAAAGNSAALVLLVLVAASAGLLFDGDAPVGGGPGSQFRMPAADRVVLVVIDGLRNDTSADPVVMPSLGELASRGARGTAAVESLIPSTIAGIATMVEGRVPPPASFLEDFRSRPSRDGGLFAALARRHERSFVAGPSIWTDRYGQWITNAYPTPPIGEDDQGALAAGLSALDRADTRFVVLHFTHTDDAAHLHGGRSPQYTAAAAWCDSAIHQIADRLGPRSCLVVTSDHGVTDAGGHAGRENVVVHTPVVVFAPGNTRPELPPLRQRDLPRLIATALDLEWHPPEPYAPTSRWRQSGSLLLLAVCATLAAAGVVWVWSALAVGASGRPQAFYLNLSLWIMMALLLIGWRHAALALAIAALAVCATTLRRGPLRPFSACLFVGAILAALRILAEPYATRAAAAFGTIGVTSPFVPTAAATVCGIIAGRILGRLLLAEASTGRRPPTLARVVTAGMTTSVTAVVISYLAGQTLSLSTLDVRIAYRLTHLPLGLLLAAAAVVLTLSLPVLGLALGISPFIRHMPANPRSAFVGGVLALPVGSAAAAALVLALRPHDPGIAALSLSCFLRSAADIFFLSGMLAGVSLMSNRPRPAARVALDIAGHEPSREP